MIGYGPDGRAKIRFDGNLHLRSFFRLIIERPMRGLFGVGQVAYPIGSREGYLVNALGGSIPFPPVPDRCDDNRVDCPNGESPEDVRQ